MTTLDYLDAAKRHLGVESDYALSKALGLTTSAISNYRAGRSRIDDDVALKLAKILEINPLEPIAQANLERAKTPDLREMWQAVLEKISKGFDDLISGAGPRGTRVSAC